MILSQPSPEQAADIVAICHLAASYSEAVSRGAIEEAVLVYAHDGVLRSPTTENAVGHAAIAEVIGRTTAGFDLLFQSTHLGLVNVSGDRANARFPITEWARRSSDGQALQFLGLYEDELRRTSDGWRFASRMLVPRTLGKPSHFTGKVHAPIGLRETL